MAMVLWRFTLLEAVVLVPFVLDQHCCFVSGMAVEVRAAGDSMSVAGSSALHCSCGGPDASRVSLEGLWVVELAPAKETATLICFAATGLDP